MKCDNCGTGSKPEVWHWQSHYDDVREWRGPFPTRQAAIDDAEKSYTAFRLRGGTRATAEYVLPPHDLDAIDALIDGMESRVDGGLGICPGDMRDAIVLLIEQEWPLSVPTHESCTYEDIGNEGEEENSQ